MLITILAAEKKSTEDVVVRKIASNPGAHADSTCAFVFFLNISKPYVLIRVFFREISKSFLLIRTCFPENLKRLT